MTVFVFVAPPRALLTVHFNMGPDWLAHYLPLLLMYLCFVCQTIILVLLKREQFTLLPPNVSIASTPPPSAQPVSFVSLVCGGLVSMPSGDGAVGQPPVEPPPGLVCAACSPSSPVKIGVRVNECVCVCVSSTSSDVLIAVYRVATISETF